MPGTVSWAIKQAQATATFFPNFFQIVCSSSAQTRSLTSEIFCRN